MSRLLPEYQREELRHNTDASYYVGQDRQIISYENTIYKKYLNSEFGQYDLEAEPRYYSQFGYHEPTYRHDLGDAVNQAKYPKYLHDEVMLPLLKRQTTGKDIEQLSSKEIVALRIASMISEYGKSSHPKAGIAVANFEKTLDEPLRSDQKEIVVRRHLSSDLLKAVPENDLKRAEGIVVLSEIPEKRASLPVHAFFAAHALSEFLIGMRAGRLATVLSESEHNNWRQKQRTVNLSMLALRLTNGHYGNLINAADTFPYIEEQIFFNESAYREMQRRLIDS